jgi:hypothetical protein
MSVVGAGTGLMSEAPARIVEQAQRLVAAARLLPAEEAAQVLEQAVIMMQTARAEILVAAERSGRPATAAAARCVCPRGDDHAALT